MNDKKQTGRKTPREKKPSPRQTEADAAKETAAQTPEPTGENENATAASKATEPSGPGDKADTALKPSGPTRDEEIMQNEPVIESSQKGTNLSIQPDGGSTTEEMVDVVLEHALGLGFYNALQTQQNQRILQSSITMAACKQILNATPAQLKNLTDPEEGIKDAAQHVRAQIQEIASAAPGSGKVQIAVSQSTVMAMQDAIDHLRNLNTISTATIGRAMAGMVQTGDMQYKEIIHQAEDMVARAAEQVNAITKDAVQIAKAFPEKEKAP